MALKVLRADVAHSAGAIDRLRDEARAASRIGSQFICDVTDFGQIPDGRVFFVMEYLEGQSLGRVLQARGALAPDRALPILRQIAKALEAAHDKGIVHLDMKPDNVMLLARGRRQDAVKVVDFGVARLMSSVARREDKVVGHARIRVARALPGRGLRPPGRHLRPRRAGLRDPDRHGPVPRAQLPGHLHHARGGRAAAAGSARRWPAAFPGRSPR